MEVLLSRDSYSELRLLSFLNLNQCGVLLGHERGNAIIVEKVLSFGSNFPDMKKLAKINDLIENRLVGFFSFYEKIPFSDLLIPLNVGLILLRINEREKESMQIKADLIDFKENKITFTPIKVKML